MKRQKATKAIAKQRVEEVLQILLDGAQIWDVREYVRERSALPNNPWTMTEGQEPLADKTLWRYMALANKEIERSCRTNSKRLVHEHAAKRRHIYGKAVSAGNLDTALRVLDSLAKLQGLFPTGESLLADQLKKLTDRVNGVTAAEKPTERIDGESGDAGAREGAGESTV